MITRLERKGTHEVCSGSLIIRHSGSPVSLSLPGYSPLGGELKPLCLAMRRNSENKHSIYSKSSVVSISPSSTRAGISSSFSFQRRFSPKQNTSPLSAPASSARLSEETHRLSILMGEDSTVFSFRSGSVKMQMLWDDSAKSHFESVSYTHLTLPTIERV